MKKHSVVGLVMGWVCLFISSAESQTCINCTGASANGTYSSALGQGANASGYCSLAFGMNTSSSNLRSIALGSNSSASGMSSIAIGNLVRSGGYNSIVMGLGCGSGPLQNNISNSLVIGFNSTIPTMFIGPAPEPNASGNVGIGTTAPAEKLSVNGVIQTMNGGIRFPDGSLQLTKAKNPWQEAMEDIYYEGGYVGIGTNMPAASLDVYGDIVLGKPGDNFILHSRSWAGDALIIAPQNSWGGWDWNKSITLKDNGQVFIGSEQEVTSANPNYRLAVNGKVVSKEMVVTVNGWADNVFEKNYRLPDLKEVERYIFENRHLKGIPPAEDVMKNGINLGEMNRMLLSKVEELTLYVIQQEREIELLKEAIRQ